MSAPEWVTGLTAALGSCARILPLASWLRAAMEGAAPLGCGDGAEPESDSTDDALRPSELGTKAYWDSAYERELQTFHDLGDVGEIWFGEGSMDRVITWLGRQTISSDAAFLDIGTGNGVFLIELARAGFSNLTGIDYSTSAVELAKAIVEKEQIVGIKLQVADFLCESPNLSHYEVCIDKGTFDAVSLSPDHPADKQRMYLESLHRVLKEGGLFLITSCNWTREELINHFSEGFQMLHELPTPKFQFGGKSGNSVTALVFKRKTQVE